MITWLLLVSLFSKSAQDRNGQENGVHCGPQNLRLTSSDQRTQNILVTWGDEPSCSAVQDVLIYELTVLIADKPVHHDYVEVMPDQIGATHSWNWTSYLAKERHSVRLRSRYKNHTSPWTQEHILPGMKTSDRTGVFPKDKSFRVGSRVTFYCVVPAREVFHKMYLRADRSDDMNTTKISDQIYALTILLNQASKYSCTDVLCETNAGNPHGACAYIGYPPDYRDLRCETRDLKSVECSWKGLSEEKDTYQLLGKPCTELSGRRCSGKDQFAVGEKNWTFTATNRFGTVELSEIADLTKRVRMLPPKVTASTVNARNASLELGWTVPQYDNLSVKCQVNIGENTKSETFGVGLKFVTLTDLTPNSAYNVKVRCGTVRHFWKWGDWSKTVIVHTKGDVPDALDVWMQMKDNQVITIWKVPLANQSHGHIEDYEVTWTKTAERERPNRTKVAPSNHSLALSLDTTEENIITVTARNVNGSSRPSTITVPSLNADRTKVKTSWIVGSNGSFNLSWSASLTASCGYIVDWRPTLGHDIVAWLKVPPNETTANIFSEDFKDGLRYSLSIYACTQGAPELLEIQEGYVHEERIADGLFKPLNGIQRDSDYEVTWDRIPLREQTAFIHGYVLYCMEYDNNIAVNSTDDPGATSLTAKNLKISSYTFTVKAKTALGECGTESIKATLNAQNDSLFKVVIISLIVAFVVLFFAVILLFRHWTYIKTKVYPPIPKPVLRSMGEHISRPLHTDWFYHTEADIVDVPQLFCSTGAPINGYASQENAPFVFAQTPTDHHLQPPPLTPFIGVFPNPLYSHIMQPGDQQFKSGPELQERRYLERCSSEYQPQDPIETFTVNQTEKAAESPMSCDSTYILLPQSPFR